MRRASELSAAHDPIATTLVRHGYIGVQIFFAISGFILALPFAERKMSASPSPSLRAYFSRRITRLEPPYIINLLICFVALVAMGKYTVPYLVKHLLASVFYLHGLLYGEGSVLNPVTWSLEIEVQFYAMAPLLCTVFAIHDKIMRRAALALVVAVGYAVRYALHAWLHFPAAFDNAGHGQLLLDYLAYFAAGMLAVDFYLNEWREAEPSSGAWDLIGLGSAVALFRVLALSGRFGNLSMLIAPFLVLLLLCAAFRGPLLSRVLRDRAIATTGGMCYTIYLYHFLVVSVVETRSVHVLVSRAYWPNFLLQCAIVGPAVLLVSSAAFVAFEKPFMHKDWPARLWALNSWMRGKEKTVEQSSAGAN